MSPVMAPNGGERSRLHELEALAYLEPVREFLRENSSSVLRVNPSEDALAQMDAEIATSAAFLEEQSVELPDRAISEEERKLIDENFTGLMARLVKISSNAARLDAEGIRPFGEITEEEQRNIREQMFTEYVELCDMLSGGRGKISKMASQSSVALYYNPSTVQELIYENEDLDRTNVVRIISEKPVSAQQAMDRAREEFERAAKRFPTIPHSVLKTHIVKAPVTYETGIRKYAEEYGLVLEPKKGKTPAPDHFLETLRTLLRSPDYHMNALRPPGEFREIARQLGKDALALMDEGESATDDPNLREGFRRKAELLTLAANRAWRRGDLPVSPDQASEKFRQALFERVLGDFLEIQDVLSGENQHTYSKSIDLNPVLYYGPEEIRQIVSDNPDLRTGHIRVLIARHPERPEAAIEDFRAKTDRIMALQPRLLRTEAMVIAVQKSEFEADGPENGEPAEKLPPAELIGAVRAHLKDDVYIATVSGDIKQEIGERRTEILELFETSEWTFAGIELPEPGQKALMKKIEEFITASERVYRVKGTTPRLRDYAPDERSAMYQELAENFAKLSDVFKPRTAADWKTTPVLYMDAEELADLRSEYDELTDWAFRRVLERGYRDAAGAFERFDRTIAELTRLYPGLSPAFTRRMALERPGSADKTIMDHIRNNSETLYRRIDSKKEIPDPDSPEGIRTNLQTLIRHEHLLTEQVFEDEREEQIGALRTRAVSLIAGLEGSENLDGANLKKLLDHLEDYVRASEALHEENGRYPGILGLPEATQDGFIETVYENQLTINKLVANGSGSQAFRVYSFGFFHNSSYLPSLWKHYQGHLPQNIITFTALMSPQRPYHKLNGLIEYQAELLKADPDLTAEDISETLWKKARQA